MRKAIIARPWQRLLPLAALLLGATIGIEFLQRADQTPFYEYQIRAAQRVLGAYRTISAYAVDIGLEFDEDRDPNRTGFIGTSFSEITTTAGHLPAKRTSTNPDFAAYLVRLLSQHASPNKGPVAITLSGSFPALGLASIVACEELGLEVILLSSVGSSSFGANRPELTWLDMERVLAEANVIHTRTRLASFGGAGDVGGFLSEDGRSTALEAIQRVGVEALLETSFEEQLAGKVSFLEHFNPQLLINIGGNAVHYGPAGHRLPSGVLEQAPVDTAELGVVGWGLESGLTVVHFLNIDDLALRHGIAIDPVPFPTPGRSPIYYQGAVSLAWPVGVLVAGVFAYLAGLGALRARDTQTLSG